MAAQESVSLAGRNLADLLEVPKIIGKDKAGY
jgi:hypothetical protein